MPNGHPVRVHVEYRSDLGDADTAVTVALELVGQGAVAIVGSDSESTAAILSAGLDVPVLSALSTAPALGRPRDPWFFRLTIADDERVRQFLKTLRRWDGIGPNADAAPIARGVQAVLRAQFGGARSARFFCRRRRQRAAHGGPRGERDGRRAHGRGRWDRQRALPAARAVPARSTARRRCPCTGSRAASS